MLNSIPFSLFVSHEEEKDSRLPFLNILLTKRPDGTVQRNCETIPGGRYLQFSSFAQVVSKRGLVQTLFYRMQKISTQDQVQNEEDSQNGRS